MNIKIVVSIFVIGLITEGHAELYCYVCENCPDGTNLSEEFLMPCSGEETTIATTPTSSTEQSSTSLADSTTIAISSPDPTTTTLATTTTVQSTQLSSETSAETTTEPSTTQNTSPSSVGTTVAQSSTLSTVPVPESSITTTSPLPATESTFTTSETTTATIPSLPPTTTGQTAGTPPPIPARLTAKQSIYNCYKFVNATQHVNRGCVVASPNVNDMCRRANDNELPEDCSICGTDKCNKSNRLVLSVFLLLFSVVVGTVLSLQ